MVCEECGKASEYNLCVECVRDLDEDDRFERFMQAEEMVMPKDPRERQEYQCPKCNGLDCIYGDFVLNDWEEFKPKLTPTDNDMWCQYSYNGEIVQGNTLLDEIQELSFACTKCGYNFNGDDEELNENIVTVIEAYRWDDE
tara:strand:- start:2367 stop:2789 length:423 start_codon:yes stop_codon:yes gene_type:complete